VTKSPLFLFWTLALFALLTAGCSAPDASPATLQQPSMSEGFPAGYSSPERSPDEITLGITVLGIIPTSGGYMLDFRYRVDEPEKSGPMFVRKTIPYLIHDETGSRYMVPAPAKIGPMRQTTRKPEAGRHYFIFFSNPGKVIKSGDHVTVVMGDFRFPHLKVL